LHIYLLYDKIYTNKNKNKHMKTPEDNIDILDNLEINYYE
jgi:hypothetical protein